MTTSSGTAASAILDRAAKAAEMRLLGLLLERPTHETRARIEALAAESGDADLRAIAEGAKTLDEPSYVALLGPGGPVSPREVSYRRREDPGSVMADVASFYEAFGYRPRAEDPVDHVAVEAGFVAFLRLKEAYLLERQVSLEVVEQARLRFIEDHLSILAGGLAARLEEVSAPELLGAARALAARTGDRQVTAIDGAADEDGAMTCGGCAPPADA